MIFGEPLCKAYSGPSLGSWASLPIIAIGPRGGQIVGYTSHHDPIYAGSRRGNRLAAMRTPEAEQARKKNPVLTQSEMLDWLNILGFPPEHLQWVETEDKQNLTVVVSPAAGKVLQEHFHLTPQIATPHYVRFWQKDLKPHIGKPLTPMNAEESATFKAKAAAGELEKDPFPPLTNLEKISPGVLAGSHGNYVFKSPDGRKWLFKHASSKSCRAEEAAVRLGRLLMGPGLIQAGKHVTLDGKPGVLLEVIPGNVVSAESHSKFPIEVSQKYFDTIVQHQVVDWLISNHDSHGGNWIETPDGKLAGIDKGQSWKFLGDDKLDTEYQPNHSKQIYLNFWKQFKQGQIIGDPVKAASAILDKIDKISDEQFLSIVGPAAQETSDPTKTAQRMLDRLHSMRMDFSKFLSEVTGTHVSLTPGPKLVIPTEVPHAKIVEKPVSKIQVQSNANILHSHFEAAAKVGDTVSVRWTSMNDLMVGKGKIVKQNAKSWVVELSETVHAGPGATWPIGQKIKVPNKLAWKQWTWNNTIMPPMEVGDSVTGAMTKWGYSEAGKAALKKPEKPVEIAEPAKPAILEKPAEKPPMITAEAPAGWPQTKGLVTVLHPGTPPAPDVDWPKGYPGAGFKAEIKYKHNSYAIEFALVKDTPKFVMTYPDGQVKSFDSPNAAADSMVLFHKKLPLDTSATDKKLKYKISYPAAKAFGIQKFQQELAQAHSATAAEFKEKFPEVKVAEEAPVAAPTKPSASNWEWFETHKTILKEMFDVDKESAKLILDKLPPDTMLQFVKGGYNKPFRYIHSVAGTWIDEDGDAVSADTVAELISKLPYKNNVYYAVPTTLAAEPTLPKKEVAPGKPNWEWFEAHKTVHEGFTVGGKEIEDIENDIDKLPVGTMLQFTQMGAEWGGKEITVIKENVQGIWWSIKGYGSYTNQLIAKEISNADKTEKIYVAYSGKEAPSTPNWEWFETHKIIDEQLTMGGSVSQIATILASLSPETMLSFTSGWGLKYYLTRTVSGNWVDPDDNIIADYKVADLIASMGPEDPVYFAHPPGVVQEGEPNWEWFDELNIAGKTKTKEMILEHLIPLEPGTIIRYVDGEKGIVFEYQKTPVNWKQIKGPAPEYLINSWELAYNLMHAVGGIEIAKPVPGTPATKPPSALPEPINVTKIAEAEGFIGGEVIPGSILPVGAKKSFPINFGKKIGNIKTDIEITPTGALIWLETEGKPGPWPEGQLHVAAGFNSLSAAANWLGTLKAGYASSAEYEKAWDKKPAYDPAIVFGITQNNYNKLLAAAEPSPTLVTPSQPVAGVADKWAGILYEAPAPYENWKYVGGMDFWKTPSPDRIDFLDSCPIGTKIQFKDHYSETWYTRQKREDGLWYSTAFPALAGIIASDVVKFWEAGKNSIPMVLYPAGVSPKPAEKFKGPVGEKVTFLPSTVTTATIDAAPVGTVWEWSKNGAVKLVKQGKDAYSFTFEDKPPSTAINTLSSISDEWLQAAFAAGGDYYVTYPAYTKWLGLLGDTASPEWKWVANYNFWYDTPKDAIAFLNSLPKGTKLRWQVKNWEDPTEDAWEEYELDEDADGNLGWVLPGVTIMSSEALLEEWPKHSTSIPLVSLPGEISPETPVAEKPVTEEVEPLPTPQAVKIPKPKAPPKTKIKKATIVNAHQLPKEHGEFAAKWLEGLTKLEETFKDNMGKEVDVNELHKKPVKWPAWCPPPFSLVEGEYEGKKYYMGVSSPGVHSINGEPSKSAKIYVITPDGIPHYSVGHGIANNLKWAGYKAGLPHNVKQLKQIFKLEGTIFLPGETLKSVQGNTGLSSLPTATTDNVKPVAEQSPAEQKQQVKAEMSFPQWMNSMASNVHVAYDMNPETGKPTDISLALAGSEDPAGDLMQIAKTLGISSEKIKLQSLFEAAVIKFSSQDITTQSFTDVVTAHQWASSAPVVSEDNWETMPEDYPKTFDATMHPDTINYWLSTAPKGTKLYIPHTDAVYEVEPAGVTHLGMPGKFWTHKEWANLFVAHPAIKELTVVPPGVALAEVKAMKPAIAGVGTAVSKPKPLSAEQLAKIAKAKEVAAWSKTFKSVTDPAALHVLAHLQKALEKVPIWARQGEGDTILLGGKDSTLVQEYLHAHITDAVDVDTPLGVLTAVTVPHLQAHFTESGMITGPDGKEYPAGTKFETETVKTTVAEMLVGEVTKISEHKHKADTHNYLKINGTDEAAKIKLQAVLDKFGLKPDGEIKAAEKYTGVGVEKSALAKIHHTSELVKAEVPEGPPPFMAATLPSFGGDQPHRQTASINRGDLSILDTITLPWQGRWIWCGKHGVFDYNQVKAYKVQTHEGKTYYQISGRLRFPDAAVGGLPSTTINFLASEYNAEKGMRKEGTSVMHHGSFNGKGITLDSGTIVEVVDQPEFRSIHGEFRIRIPEGADVENELSAAFSKMGLNPTVAMAEPDEHDQQMFMKSMVLRSFMGPAGYHVAEKQWTTEKWLDEKLESVGATKYLATAEVTHDWQGKTTVLIHDEDKVAEAHVGFVYSGRGSRSSLVGRLLEEGLASHQSRFQAGKVGGHESLGSDLAHGGSNVSFCRIGNNKSNGSWGMNCGKGFNMIYHPRILQRADWYAQNGDIYGESGNHHWPRQEQFNNTSENNEIDFESGMANGDLAGCLLREESEKTAIIDMLKGRGITSYNSIPLDKFFMVYNGHSRKYISDNLYGLQPGVLP